MELIPSFITVVGLIGQFRAERSGLADADFNEFMIWLVDANHVELKVLVEQNPRTVIGIKALLNERHKVFRKRLEMLDSALAAYSSSLPGFSDLTEGLNPQSAISDQALNILQEFDASGGSKFIVADSNDELAALLYLDADDGIGIEDARFLEEDLNTLVDLKLLRVENPSSGEAIYHLTRAATRFAAMGRISST
jgi:hypothetical protein